MATMERRECMLILRKTRAEDEIFEAAPAG